MRNLFFFITIFFPLSIFGITEELKFNKPSFANIVLEENMTGENFFQFDVDDSIFGIKIVVDSPVDLDIFLNNEKYGEKFNKNFITDGTKKTLVLTRAGSLKLLSGKYFMVVVYDDFKKPIINGKFVKEIPYKILIETEKSPEVDTVDLNKIITINLNEKNSWTKFYKIKTENLNGLYIQTFNPDSDVDVYVFFKTLNYDFQLANYKSDTFAGTESIKIGFEKSSPFNNGIYYIMVVDKYTLNLSKNVSMFVSDKKDFLPDSPKDLKFTKTDGKTERAVFSTVGIICKEKFGTGVFVSPKGHILTASHVIKNSDKTVSDRIVISLNFSEKEIARELFFAKVLYIDDTLDLALLQIGDCVYNNFSIDFYYFNLDTPDPKLGDEIYAMGYPASGGTSSKNSIRMTKGILSGFEYKKGSDFFISDVKIDLGNSGGPLLNEDFNLIGIVAEILQSNITEFASIFPISKVPKLWRDKIKNE